MCTVSPMGHPVAGFRTGVSVVEGVGRIVRPASSLRRGAGRLDPAWGCGAGRFHQSHALLERLQIGLRLRDRRIPLDDDAVVTGPSGRGMDTPAPGIVHLRDRSGGCRGPADGRFVVRSRRQRGQQWFLPDRSSLEARSRRPDRGQADPESRLWTSPGLDLRGEPGCCRSLDASGTGGVVRTR